jgi:hypothetical protein
MGKPRVFVGSASETLGIVEALEGELHDVARIDRWDLDVFHPGHFTLDELSRAVGEADFAVFVLGRDDLTTSHNVVTPSPRDNVIFEAGLFTAVLGRERVFYVVDKAGTKIPTDWAGLGYMRFDGTEERPRDKVFDAAKAIRAAIAAWQPMKNLGPLAPMVGAWWQLVVNVEVGAVLSWLEITATEPANLVLIGTAWSKDGALLARYRSRSARFDDRDDTLYYSWEGEHPKEEAIPRFFGVGEIHFKNLNAGAASTGEGWFSSSNSSNVKDAVTKATTYHRPSAAESNVMRGTDRDARAALIQTKLSERQGVNI